MKIYFLGTCHGAQEKGRFLTCTALEVDGKMYLIDAGAPFVYLLKNMDIIPREKLETAFITHMHDDHAMHVFSCVFHCKNALYVPEESDIEGMKNLIWFYHCEWAYEHGKPCEIKSVSDGAFYDDGTIKVTAIPTKHLARGKSFAYMIEAEGKRILFSGDLSDDFSDYPQITEELDFDAVICELTHFSVENAIPKFNNTRTKRILFNHVRDDKVALLKKNQEKLKREYYITNDGDIIEV
ncbi:MAG: MBL fold metallo-hydrolase [Clostridia bacterium]|nr:MBL fold metallo-hydrolase [Clostridia bacterium]